MWELGSGAVRKSPLWQVQQILSWQRPINQSCTTCFASKWEPDIKTLNILQVAVPSRQENAELTAKCLLVPLPCRVLKPLWCDWTPWNKEPVPGVQPQTWRVFCTWRYFIFISTVLAFTLHIYCTHRFLPSQVCMRKQNKNIPGIFAFLHVSLSSQCPQASEALANSWRQTPSTPVKIIFNTQHLAFPIWNAALGQAALT